MPWFVKASARPDDNESKKGEITSDSLLDALSTLSERCVCSGPVCVLTLREAV